MAYNHTLYMREWRKRKKETLNKEVLSGYFFARQSIEQYQQNIERSLATLLVMLKRGRLDFGDSTLNQISELIELLDQMRKGLTKDLNDCNLRLEEFKRDNL